MIHIAVVGITVSQVPQDYTYAKFKHFGVYQNPERPGWVNPDTRDPPGQTAPVLPLTDQNLDQAIVGFKQAILLEGGGPSAKIGVSKVHVGWIRNVLRNTIVIQYASGYAKYVPTSYPPWLDTGRVNAGTGGITAFTNRSYPAQGVPGFLFGAKRIVWDIDAPGISFPLYHPRTFTKFASTSGSLLFYNFLSAFSDDANKDYSVLLRLPWRIYFIGNNVGDTWVSAGSKVVFGQKAVYGPAARGTYVGLQPYPPLYSNMTVEEGPRPTYFE